MNLLPLLQACFENNRVYYTRHARFEMEAEEFGVIFDSEVYDVICNGEVLREYPDDAPYPSVLILGRTGQDRPLHVVCAYDTHEQRAFVVTVYQPDPTQWIEHRARRKK